LGISSCNCQSNDKLWYQLDNFTPNLLLLWIKYLHWVMADHEIQNLHSKQPLNKTQSSKLCKLGVKKTCFQNLKENRNWFFGHCGTLGNSGLFHKNHWLLKMKIIILFQYLAACVGSYRVFSVYCHKAWHEIPKFVSKCGIWLTVMKFPSSKRTYEVYNKPSQIARQKFCEKR